MDPRHERLLAVLCIGHDTSMRGEGVSLRQALSRVDYLETRRQLVPQDLVPLLRARRELIDQWIMYSEDKRTSGGWYVTEAGEVGQVDDPNSRMCFASVEEAVAEYVVRELDFWATV
jgi:hypothetical protein